MTWNGYLLDGHHRLKICKKHGLAYKTVAYEFEYQEEVEIWMIDNQCEMKRNITEFCRGRYALLKKERIVALNKKKMTDGSEKGGEANKQRYEGSPPPTLGDLDSENSKAKDYSGNTDRLLAKDAGLSVGTMHTPKKKLPLPPFSAIRVFKAT